MTTYSVISGASEVETHAQSSLHAIDGRATEVDGTIDVGILEDRVVRLDGGRIEVPVATLKSGNPLEDAELQRRADARRFPTIVGEVRQATPLGDGGRFRVEGDVTFHGITREVVDDLRVAVDGGQLILEGEHVFDIREFGIKPPRILMLRVEPMVTVRIRLVAEPAESITVAE